MRINVTVSKSSLGTFDECERKWLLQYQRWKMPLDMRRDLFYQYRLMGHNALVGQVVDDVITYSLRLYERKGEWPEKRREGAERLLQQYLDETENWRDSYENSTEEPQEGRRQPIDKYFFGEPPTQLDIDSLLTSINALVETWFASGIPEVLIALGVENWRTPPKGDVLPPFFIFDGTKVWAKYDFAVQSIGSMILYDWKTGRVNEQSEEDVRNQLHTYAQFAMTEWDARPAELKLYAVWLACGPNDCLHEYPFEPERLENLKRIWVAKHELLVERLKLAGGNGLTMLELFPMTSQIHRCRGCKFRACEGYTRLESSAIPPL